MGMRQYKQALEKTLLVGKVGEGDPYCALKITKVDDEYEKIRATAVWSSMKVGDTILIHFGPEPSVRRSWIRYEIVREAVVRQGQLTRAEIAHTMANHMVMGVVNMRQSDRYKELCHMADTVEFFAVEKHRKVMTVKRLVELAEERYQSELVRKDFTHGA